MNDSEAIDEIAKILEGSTIFNSGWDLVDLIDKVVRQVRPSGTAVS